MLESELNEKLLSSSKQYFKFSTDLLTQGGLEERYRSYQLAIQSGWMSPNEARAKEGMDSVDGLSVYQMQMNMVQISKDGKEVKGVEKAPVNPTENTNIE
jgi:phage portal protein BeeE